MQRISFKRTSPPRIGPNVYKALIADLAYSTVPTAIMGATLIGVAVLAYAWIGHPAFMLAALAGAAGTIGKLVLMKRQRDLMSGGMLGFADACVCQHRHMIATLVTASSVAAIVSLLFFHAGVEWHVAGTALLFAYCSGVVGRLAVCPTLAVPALVLAAGPVIIACASWNDVPHHVTAAMFAIFLAGSFETVRHIYRSSVRHITTELDMATLARNDPLTGLFNRLGFREAFRAASGARGRLAVHCFDLDGFKAVNDRHGHAAGDRVLVEVARRVRSAAPGAAVARLRGDEFAFLQGAVIRDEDAAVLADRLLAILREPYDAGGVTVYVGASLGFAIGVDEAMDFDTLLKAADLASYDVKRAGGGVLQGRFDPLDRPATVKLRIVA